MAETLRDMVVSLSLNSDNFSANLRSINQQLKEADSQFKLAASGVTNFENTAAGAQAQLASLQQKFQLQQQAVQQYERALEAAKGKLETSVQTHEKLAAKLDTARQRHADLGQQVDKLTADLREAEEAGLKGKLSQDIDLLLHGRGNVANVSPNRNVSLFGVRNVIYADLGRIVTWQKSWDGNITWRQEDKD